MADEDITITNSINKGKQDWLKVLNKKKQYLTEEQDVMGGSDVPAPQPLSTGEKPETMANVGDTISDAGDSKEYELIKKELLLSIAKEKKNLVTKIARLFPHPDKLSLPEMVETMGSIKEELAQARDKLVPQMAQEIKKYNSVVDGAVKHTLGTMGLAVERMKLPEIVKSMDDLKNMAIFYGDFDNVIGDVMRDAEHYVRQSIGQGRPVLGASTIDEAFAGKRNVQRVDDPINSLTKIKTRIPRKYQEVIKNSGIAKDLANVFILAAKHEVYDAMIKGIEQKLQRLAASAKAQDAVKAKQEAEIIVLDPADFQVSPDEKVDALEENVPVSIPRIGHGPGKVVDSSMLHEEEKEVKKVSLNECWNKYHQKNKDKVNKEKPDDFTLVMG